MKHPRNSTSDCGFQLTSEAAAFLNREYPRPYRFTPDALVVLEQEKPNRQKIDAIIAEIRAPKPAPTTCWGCGCTSPEIATVGNHPPAYICPLCDLWLGDVNPEINVKWELSRKYEDLLILLPRIPLNDESQFQETLETIQLIRAEILQIESE